MACAICAIDAITTATASPNTAIIVRVAVRIVKEVSDAVRAVGSLITRSSRWIWTTEAATFCFAPLVTCLLYTSPSPRDYAASRMPSSA